jgi:hypothetical protein
MPSSSALVLMTQRALPPVVGCVGGRGELLAVGRGDDVGERGDAVCEGLVVVVVVFDADVAGVGLCGDGALVCD